jgi:hypothetical protein
MLTELCAEVRNYFLGADPMRNIHQGTYTISGGAIAPLDFLTEGQYFRIVGSTFNDGVHQYPASDLTDESFAGAVWAMAVPPAVIGLAVEIEKYKAETEKKLSGYSSESFGGYSYTKFTDSHGAPLSWEKAFAGRLNKYRRMNVL